MCEPMSARSAGGLTVTLASQHIDHSALEFRFGAVLVEGMETRGRARPPMLIFFRQTTEELSSFGNNQYFVKDVDDKGMLSGKLYYTRL